jgi:BlaI family transcriptional regulator, penicillinase repressor
VRGREGGEFMGGESGDGLSRRERQIMDAVYARGEASAAEVHGDLPDAPGQTAVRTMLRILEEKGHLKHRQEGLKYIYRPSRPRGRAGRSALKKVLRTFFDGSLEKAVAAHLSDPAAELSPSELERLAELIRQARRGKGRGEP